MNRRFLTLEQLKSVASALLAKINQKPDSSSLSDVSFTGDYNDLSNKPDFSNFVNQTTLQNSYEAAMQQVGEHCMVIGRDYVTAGQLNGSTLGDYATAEGDNTTASGYASHAEGNNTTARGHDSHAEGNNTTARGLASHAEGDNTTASGYASHAEGGYTAASGEFSYAEGYYTTASGNYSHAEGWYTTAQRRSQHVFGEYNVLDTTGSTTSNKGSYVEIVGNGTSSTRSNARTLDWSGNETLAGKLTVGAGPTNNMDVATKQYVDSKEVPPEVFLVTAKTSNETITADKTYAEILAAYNAGKICVVNFDHWHVCPLMYISNRGASFCKTATTTDGAYQRDVSVTDADVWNTTVVPLQTRTTASGILKGDGAGGVTAAVAGTDYVKDYVTAGQKNGTTLGFRATAEGNNTSAIGYYSHAEGDNTSAIGHYSHAEGSSATASGNAAHAEGSSTTASGESAHAEGSSTTASGESAHAEGSGTSASGTYAHAEGYFTNARRKSQHVFGEYNVLDTTGTTGTQRGAYIEIVGKGTADNARSNARTLDWSGNEVLAGKLTVGAAPTANMDVATKQYVDATRTVVQGGTGATSFTANCVIMSGSSTTAALTTRAVTNNTATSGAVSANTNIPTMNTLRFAINRTTSVAAADTGYTTYMARGEALNSADTNPTVNGAISWTYA